MHELCVNTNTKSGAIQQQMLFIHFFFSNTSVPRPFDLVIDNYELTCFFFWIFGLSIEYRCSTRTKTTIHDHYNVDQYVKKIINLPAPFYERSTLHTMLCKKQVFFFFNDQNISGSQVTLVEWLLVMPQTILLMLMMRSMSSMML